MRKNYFIDKEFQIRFILKFCFLFLAGIGVSTSLIFLFSRDTLTSSFNQSRLIIENTPQAIFPTVIYTSLVTLFLLTIATIIVTLFISYKIAGPLFRFEKELKEIGEGNLIKKVILRKDDQATALAGCINEMTAGLHEKITHIQTKMERMLASARKQNASPDLIIELENLCKEMISNLKT